jgi:hypothetical protein
MDATGQQDVTVCRRSRSGKDRNGAARARAIFNDQPIGELLAKDGRDRARETVDTSTRTIRHDDFDDPLRPIGCNRTRYLNRSHCNGRKPDQPIFPGRFPQGQSPFMVAQLHAFLGERRQARA